MSEKESLSDAAIPLNASSFLAAEKNTMIRKEEK